VNRWSRSRTTLAITGVAVLLAAVFASHPHLEGWAAFLFSLPVSLFYLFPSYVASLRGHRKLIPIAAVNLLLGWTILGWIAALVWSLTRWGTGRQTA